MPYCYTNRCGEHHFFKKIQTRKGGYRYYITKDPNVQDLIEEVPEGFEAAELPHDGKVVMRKKIPLLVTKDEEAVVRRAMEEYSPVKDFLVLSERITISIHISQFSHYHDATYPDAEEVRSWFDENVDKWKRYDWLLSFTVVDERLRIWSVVRKADALFDSVEIERSTNLELLAEKYCHHVGRESMLQFWIPGEDF